MISNIYKTTSTPNGVNPTDLASNDTMPQTQSQIATERLSDLRSAQQERINALMEAQHQHDRTLKELADARSIVDGYARTTRPADIAYHNEAQARLTQLQERSQAETAHIAALKGEADAADAHIAALFEGEHGYEVAVQLYREVKAEVAELDAALTAHRAQQQTAADALAKAQQVSATAAQHIQTALDAEAITRVRADLTAAQQAEGDAQTLLDNLDRHIRALTSERDAAEKAMEQAQQRAFQCKAAVLVAALKQQLTDAGLDAFAAALLAGPPMHFQTWLAQVIDSDPAAVRAHQAALREALETATALEVTDA